MSKDLNLHCPDSSSLERFLLGLNDQTGVVTLDEHVSVCPHCLKRMAAVQAEDNLTIAIRNRSEILAITDLTDVDRFLGDSSRMSFFQAFDQDAPRSSPAQQAAATIQNMLEPPLHDDELGRLNKYRVLKVLGSGGMGIVFHAEDNQLKRPVALKVLLESRFADSKYISRFQAEAGTLARLHHPNIVQIYEVGEHRGRTYLALEYVADGNLADRLHGEPQSIRECATFMSSLATAVGFAHQSGIIHRDLKPANILLRKHDAVKEKNDASARSIPLSASKPLLSSFAPKITDFGLARELEEEGLTQTGELLGTPGYLAPELTMGNDKANTIGPQADVFSLGAILYEMLTGRPPFRGESAFDTLKLTRSADPLAPRKLRATIPRDIETICLKCLEKDPLRRYANATALSADLRQFLEGRPIQARPASIVERAWKSAKRRPTTASLVAVSVLFLGVLVWGSLLYQQELKAVALDARNSEKLALKQSELAEAQYKGARDTVAKMVERTFDPNYSSIPKLTELRRAQLEDALAFSLKSAQLVGDNPVTREHIAFARFEAGRMQMELGRRTEGMSNLELAVKQYRELAENDPSDLHHREVLAKGLKHIGAWSGLSAEAKHALEEAITLSEALCKEQPENVTYLHELSSSKHNLGNYYFGYRNFADAAKLYREALKLSEQTATLLPSLDTRYSVAQTKTNLIITLLQSPMTPALQKELDELDRQIVATFKEAIRTNPSDMQAKCNLATHRVNWGHYLADRKHQPQRALDDLADSIAALTKIRALEPTFAMAKDSLYMAYGVSGEILFLRGRWKESVEMFRHVVELAPPDKLGDRRVTYAMALANSGDYAGGKREFESGLKQNGPNPNPLQLDAAATGCACLSIAASRSNALSPDLRKQESKQWADKSVELLKRAKKEASPEQWKQIVFRVANLSEYARIRERKEVKELIANP